MNLKSYAVNLILISSFIVNILDLSAQNPKQFSYQAVIRNSGNLVVQNKLVGLRLSILQGTATGTVVYSEVHNPTTNINGLFTLEVGNGKNKVGDIAIIDWSKGPYFLKTETDLDGGSNYTIYGTTQILSVPLALHSETSTTSYNLKQMGATVGQTIKWNGTSWVPANDSINTPFNEKDTTLWKSNSKGIYLPKGNVGIGFSDTSSIKLFVWGDILANDGMYYISGPKQTSFPKGDQNSLIYQTRGTAGLSYPFANSGHLVLQSVTALDRDIIFVTGKDPSIKMVLSSNGNLGIGPVVPARKLHVNDAMRLEPLDISPSNPKKGDIYFDGVLNKLRVYDGTQWQNCW
jgi:hypothetical protein